jgi:acetylornithine deacetylase/succinyl-diaminopimelate desuccinylase-like protein
LRGAAAALLARAIQRNTTNPPGRERPLAEDFAAALAREGVETRVIPLPTPESPRAALWARVRGTGGAAPLVLLSHLDVVPATEEDWVVDPFAGVVGGGYVVGRGALDAKGVLVTHALALMELARRPQKLARDVILLATPDEEVGGQEGAGLITREYRELLGGATYLLTEGAGIVPSEGVGPDVWHVAFTEKTPCWVRVTAHGIPGHGSSASETSAVDRLVRALARVQALPQEVEVVPEVAAMFARMAPLARPEDRASWRELRGALALNPSFREQFLSDPGRRALVQNTLAFTVLKGSDTINVLPATATAGIDARLLPGQSCSEFVERLAGAIDDSAVELAIDLDLPSHASPTSTPLMTAIEHVAERASPKGFVVSRVIAGFTDAHYFRALGITAYGFVPRRLTLRESRGIHGPNERVSLDNLELGVHTTVAILDELERVEHRP